MHRLARPEREDNAPGGMLLFPDRLPLAAGGHMAVRIGRRQLIAVLGGAAASWPPAVRAQQTATVPRIGILTQGSGPGPGFTRDFRDGLRELGWLDGQNIAIDYRFADGRLDELGSLANDLVRLKVDVIATAATPAAKAAQNATRAIPIVIIDPGDPVETGLVASLARPGGNITGQASIAPDLIGKRLQLLKEATPSISRVAILFNAAIPPAEVALKELRVAAATLNVDIVSIEVHGQQDFESAFDTIVRERANGLLVFHDPLMGGNAELIVSSTNKRRLPAMFWQETYVRIGGLMSYGPSYSEMFRRAGNYVGRILKGTKPADLPVEQPTRFYLNINLNTAKAMGIEMPASLRALADALIE
jgi:putative tryptophan/tyrosine transport system substrate-binding protein